MVEHSMDLEIDGNAALVTALSSGLGTASAKALAREVELAFFSSSKSSDINGAAIPIDGGATGANP